MREDNTWRVMLVSQRTKRVTVEMMTVTVSLTKVARVQLAQHAPVVLESVSVLLVHRLVFWGYGGCVSERPPLLQKYVTEKTMTVTGTSMKT